MERVLNQPPPLANYNLFTSDPVLAAALEREGAGWAEPLAREFGARLGTEEAIEWGMQANENPPVLHTHDRFGRRQDEVKFHPAWHSLMALSVQYGVHNLPLREERPGSHAARTALLFLASQNEAGHTCPVSMTHAAVAALRHEPAVLEVWRESLVSPTYDPRFRPAAEKSGCLMGMGMTEKQGGSDVRANITEAEPLGGGEYRISGHKWFCSAPMCDAFLVLAQAPGGLTCFLLPRWTPEGERNAFHIQRLKSKLGNRSNASSEVEFERAWALRVGEEGRGVRTIIDMVQRTRLDCAAGSAGLMRQALVQAVHHARYRKAFGKLLIDQPLMQNVLADLALESEAATILAMRIARAFDRAEHGDGGEQAFARLATAAGKYWLCKRALAATGEAMECLGGNGYVEESMMPRLYREAPVNAIWEGSGNVISLDVLRAIRKEPAAVEAVFREIRLARGGNRAFDHFSGTLEQEVTHPEEVGARSVTEHLALGLEGSLMIRYASNVTADTFCASRLSTAGGHLFGTLPANAGIAAILDRNTAAAGR